jgi:hypothetical protein
VGAVDPAMLLKGVDVLLLDLQADLPLVYRYAFDLLLAAVCVRLLSAALTFDLCG